MKTAVISMPLSAWLCVLHGTAYAEDGVKLYLGEGRPSLHMLVGS